MHRVWQSQKSQRIDYVTKKKKKKEVTDSTAKHRSDWWSYSHWKAQQFVSGGEAMKTKIGWGGCNGVISTVSCLIPDNTNKKWRHKSDYIFLKDIYNTVKRNLPSFKDIASFVSHLYSASFFSIVFIPGEHTDQMLTGFSLLYTILSKDPDNLKEFNRYFAAEHWKRFLSN